MMTLAQWQERKNKLLNQRDRVASRGRSTAAIERMIEHHESKKPLSEGQS